MERFSPPLEEARDILAGGERDSKVECERQDGGRHMWIPKQKGPSENYKEKCVTLNFRFRITFAIRAFWLPEVEMLQVNNPGRARPLAWEH